ncbi:MULTISPECIES: DUF4059 family protein [unclassified Lactococcus]|uniref:DUF4059 family protein n=1 Tax=unclassified Lactococcus TaxID=2643510 RepID=UPI0011C8D6AE|nr:MULTISPECIES: DUF4059 family protein [unclassified Lactococcus]MQW22327.1 DUF4059 family protein [Lactococcus sp. dk101]TXK45249.1 DUF4059 family protein [Lactococcus sp. dk310]TXK50972.1 DUF4059 family protein [Lactococcus sp. dk322]
MVLQLYLQGLLISFLLMLVLSLIYALAYLVRNQDKSRTVIRNRIFDLILINLLTIPVLSFAFLGILVILKTRAL